MQVIVTASQSYAHVLIPYWNRRFDVYTNVTHNFYDKKYGNIIIFILFEYRSFIERLTMSLRIINVPSIIIVNKKNILFSALPDISSIGL